MPKETPAQTETVERVMHEFKHGELKSGGNGAKVKSRRQAIAIALHEAGATNGDGAKTNRRNLAKTKGKERRGETAQAETETGPNATRAGLYEQARKKGIPGRSGMSKAELARALGR